MPEIESAVMDTGLDMGIDSGTGQGAEGQGGTEQVSVQSDSQPQVLKTGQTESKTEIDTSDPKQVHQAVRSSIQKLRADNPAAADALKAAYYERNELRKEFPGGLSEVRQLKQAVEQFGGREAIEQSQGELSWFKEFDNEFTAANPQVIDRMADAAPEQFVKLFPAMSEKIESLAPDAFSSWFSNRMMADFNHFGLIQDTQWIQRAGAEIPEVKQFADKMMAYFQRLSGFAQKPYAAPKLQNQQQQQGQADPMADRAHQQLEREFTFERTQIVNSMYPSELSKQLSGRSMTEAQKSAVAELVDSAINRAERSEMDKLNRYKQAGDVKGYAQLKRSILGKVLPRAIEQALSVTIGRKPGPKPVAGKPQAQAQTNGRSAPVAQQGLRQVAQKPSNNQILWGGRGTTQGDVAKGIYRLKDGSTVQWRG